MTEIAESLRGIPKLSEVLSTVSEAYSPEIAEALRAELALVAQLSYADISCCIALILEGPSGAGKSALIEMLNPIEETRPYLRREDRFTAPAFVSNASNRNASQLDKMDLLPKLKHRVMLTKELASMFGSDDKALRETFGIIAAVLDGRGYRTATGSHGERGYEGDFRFNWIGATTPVATRIHNLMAGFGCRFLFYECRFPEPDFEEISSKMKNASSYSMQEQCNALVNEFIKQHFERYKVKSVSLVDIECPDEVFKGLYGFAKLMTLGRRAVFHDEASATGSENEAERAYFASPPELVWRPIEMFRSICIGNALMSDRKRLTADDLAIIRHIAMSSIPDKRRKLLRCLIREGGRLTSTDAEKQLRCSRPTAIKWMRELAATEICAFHDNESGNNDPSLITLNEMFWFLVPKLAEE
jgi:hypothetical protein